MLVKQYIDRYKLVSLDHYRSSLQFSGKASQSKLKSKSL
ncbi:hypothetical protein C943_04389 [Mariniradius saccharolyticus AK6]|uniref:Uncharacterized protein n=1 Tax=Mariniradius saccharolyticus AK6 TaxID=1239962 RepID=M7Y8K1_9BACT|nr:hypothetical protein C943_04389 [Mariniradius saccharolyticus AK6]